MSALFLLIVSTLAFGALMVARPKLRRLLSENLSRRAAPISVRLFGPFSPKAFVASFVRAAKARATETHSGAFLPNYTVAGVAPAEYDSWGPLAKRLSKRSVDWQIWTKTSCCSADRQWSLSAIRSPGYADRDS